MRQFNRLVYDDTLAGSTTVTIYTKPELDELLGSVDQLGLHLIADNLSGGGTASLTGRIQHSADQLNFDFKNGTAEISSGTLSTNTSTSKIGGDGGATPSLGFVRIEIKFTITAAGSVHVKLWATGRNQG
jgi:hypothetical protein